MLEDVQTIMRPIVAKYLRLASGRQLRGPITPRDVEVAQLARLSTLPTRPPAIRVEAPLVMAVNHGRWIADCACRAGVTTGEGWAEARCFACGAVYVSVIWPPAAERAEIDRHLARRQAVAARNWAPGQHWSTLVAENLAHAAELLPAKGDR